MAFKRKVETPLLANLQRIAAIIGVVFVAGRLLDLLVRGQFGFALRLDVYGIFFWIENVLFILPMALTRPSATHSRKRERGQAALLPREWEKVPEGRMRVFRSAMVLAVAGALYRFDTYLLAFDSGPGWHYFPSVAELLITIGLVAFELAIYIALVKRFPILSGAAPAPVH
jgi:Ni/Fe-hydrogenase subunit HybB-like protein